MREHFADYPTDILRSRARVVVTRSVRLAAADAALKDGRQLDCELRDHGEWGVEVQVYREREFLYGRRWPRRALALEEAHERKAQYLRDGGVVIS
jgi:hypothetical protein